MFDAFVTYQARQQPQANAVVTPTGVMSFSELDAMVDRFAWALARMGLPSGGPVSVRFANPVTHWLVVLALARLGIGSACAADFAASAQIADQPDPECPLPFFHASDAWIDAASSGAAGPCPPARPAPDWVGRVLLSSGTTGPPKRIGLSWALVDTAIRNTALAYAPARPGPWLVEAGIDTVFGFTIVLAAWAAGRAVLLRQGLGLEAALARFDPALATMVPIQLQHWIGQLLPGCSARAGLRLVVTSGALHPDLALQARLRLTPEIRIVYGASECGTVAIGNATLLSEHRGAAGYVVPGAAVEIVDPEGEPVPAGELGEIRMRSNRLVEGYLDQQPGFSAIRGGWFYPGDLGRLLEDGLLLIAGRADEQMNLGGVKLMPDVVDAALAGFPGVVEACTFAAPRRSGTDMCCIALVTTAPFDQDAMRAHLARHVPTLTSVQLLFLDRMPRTPDGKAERAKLVEIARSALS